MTTCSPASNAAALGLRLRALADQFDDAAVLDDDAALGAVGQNRQRVLDPDARSAHRLDPLLSARPYPVCKSGTSGLQVAGPEPMDLNTIQAVARPQARGELSGLAGGRRLACRRHLAVFRAAAAADAADRSRRPRLGAAARRRPRAWRSPPPAPSPSSTRSTLPADWTAAPLISQCCPRLSRLVQDLEHGDGRRQPVHVAAGRADDLADRRARRRLHALGGGRRRAENPGRRFRHRPAAQRACAPASCCAASTCRPRR